MCKNTYTCLVKFRLKIFEKFIRLQKQSVPGKDSGIQTVNGMNCRNISSQRCFIHNIIVNQRKIVKKFNGQSRFHRFFDFPSEKVISHQNHDWAESFSAVTNDIVHRFVKFRRLVPEFVFLNSLCYNFLVLIQKFHKDVLFHAKIRFSSLV